MSDFSLCLLAKLLAFAYSLPLLLCLSAPESPSLLHNKEKGEEGIMNGKRIREGEKIRTKKG